MKKNLAGGIARGAATLLVCLLTWSTASPAQSLISYDIDNETWEGLSSFRALARGMGGSIKSPSSMDWSSVGRNDILLVINPAPSVDITALQGFVHKGGSLVMADDLRDAGRLLHAFGLALSPGRFIPKTESQRFQGQNFTPMATPAQAPHPLIEGIQKGVVANHASAIRATKQYDAVLTFDSKHALVVTGAFGDGTFVALSDPSVLINAMLRINDNMTFATNMIRFLTRTSAPVIHVVLGSTSLAGVAPRLPPGSAAAPLSFRLKTRFNENAVALSDYIVTERGAMLSALIGLPALFLACALLGFRSGRGARVFRTTEEERDRLADAHLRDLVAARIRRDIVAKIRQDTPSTAASRISELSDADLMEHVERHLGHPVAKILHASQILTCSKFGPRQKRALGDLFRTLEKT